MTGGHPAANTHDKLAIMKATKHLRAKQTKQEVMLRSFGVNI
jgi:hypothetical protein